MSEIMRGVLRMPPELWGDDPLSVAQRHWIYIEAADTIDRQQAEIAAIKAECDALQAHLRYWLPDETMIPSGHEAAWEAARAALDAAKGAK